MFLKEILSIDFTALEIFCLILYMSRLHYVQEKHYREFRLTNEHMNKLYREIDRLRKNFWNLNRKASLPLIQQLKFILSISFIYKAIHLY